MFSSAFLPPGVTDRDIEISGGACECAECGCLHWDGEIDDLGICRRCEAAAENDND